MFDSIWLVLALVASNGAVLGRPEALAEAIEAYKTRWRDVIGRRAARRAAHARSRMLRYHPLDRIPPLAARARRRKHAPAGPIRRFFRRLADWPVALLLIVVSHPLDALASVGAATFLTTLFWFVRVYMGTMQGQPWIMEWRAVLAGLVVAPFVLAGWATCHMQDVFPRGAIRLESRPRPRGAYIAVQIMALGALVGLAVASLAAGGTPLAVAYGAAGGLFVGSLLAYDWWWSYPIPD